MQAADEGPCHTAGPSLRRQSFCPAGGIAVRSQVPPPQPETSFTQSSLQPPFVFSSSSFSWHCFHQPVERTENSGRPEIDSHILMEEARDFLWWYRLLDQLQSWDRVR